MKDQIRLYRSLPCATAEKERKSIKRKNIKKREKEDKKNRENVKQKFMSTQNMQEEDYWYTLSIII